MQSIQRLGGIGALIAAGTFVVGLAMFATIFMDFVSATDPAEAVEFIVDSQLALHLWNTAIHIVFGIVLVPLVLAIGDRLRTAHSPLARVSSVFGLIWSGVIIATGMILNIAYTTVGDLQGTDPEMASSVWASLDAVTNGLGGGNEVLGGIQMPSTYIWDIAAAHAINLSVGYRFEYYGGQAIDYSGMIEGGQAEDLVLAGSEPALEALRGVLVRI